MDTRTLYLGVAAIAVALAASPASLSAQQAATAQVSVGPDNIGGVVTGPNGPEAGVWVVAETTDLPTRLIKSVVTDDQGRYLIPELPKANYEVFARGYGVKDSARQKSEPGKVVNLTTTAATPKEAAEHYPAIYWYSMLKMPAKHEFPLGNAKTQAEWLNVVKTNGCYECHALGNKATRTIPSVFADMKSEDAWARRIMSGQAMTNMANDDRPRRRAARAQALRGLDRSHRGGRTAGRKAAAPAGPGAQRRHHAVGFLRSQALPARHHGDRQTQADAQSERPDLRRGRELDRYHPDPRSGEPQGDEHQDAGARSEDALAQGRSAGPSPYWGEEAIWDGQTSTHNPMYDQNGRVWWTSRVGARAQSGLLQEGLGSSSAKVFPMEIIDAAYLDARSEERQDHADPHLLPDAPSGLRRGCQQYAVALRWRSGAAARSAGSTPRNSTRPATRRKSQGWTPIVLDTNGNGKRDEWVEPNQPLDPAKDKRIVGALYGIGVNPQDGTIWGSILTFPGYIVRVDPGSNPSETALAEIYEPPAPGYGPRGFDIDRNGVAWVPLSSGHMASFDRRKCKGPLNGPAAATGRHCPEGWTLYDFPGPKMQACRTSAARRRATTPGSISSTRSGSGRTSRGRPATPTSR